LINRYEIDIIASPEVQAALEAFQSVDSADFALKNAHLPHVALIAGQLKLRAKAKDKLPHWVQSGCIFDERALEQCTSEALAAEKPLGSGARALDLCCGLGVDTAQLSRTFQSVIALEADENLAALARHNFARLGITNVEVIHTTAEDWLRENAAPNSFDLIYLDPARRDDKGARKFSPDDCEPDFFALKSVLSSMTPRILLKTSPMWDWREGLHRIPETKSVVVLTVGDECKEILYEITPEKKHAPQIAVIALRKHGVTLFTCESGETPPVFPQPTGSETFLTEPDNGFYMTTRCTSFLSAQFPSVSFACYNARGYFYSAECPPAAAGNRFEILHTWAFKPGEIKKMLKSLGIVRVNFGARHFSLSIREIRPQLKLAEGGNHHLLFTEEGSGKKIAHLCVRV
jgi:protein-L-isoaspartate O-methyltransferase